MLKAFGDDTHPGLLYSFSQGKPDGSLLACQVLGALFILGWTLITMLPFFLVLNFAGYLRCESVEELVGLDVTYNGFGQKQDGYDSDLDEKAKTNIWKLTRNTSSRTGRSRRTRRTVRNLIVLNLNVLGIVLFLRRKSY
jgi:hypothetical protein